MMDRPINAVPFLFLLEKIFHALGAAAAARSSKRRRLPPLAKQSREAVAPMHHPFLPSFMSLFNCPSIAFDLSRLQGFGHHLLKVKVCDILAYLTFAFLVFNLNFNAINLLIVCSLN